MPIVPVLLQSRLTHQISAIGSGQEMHIDRATLEYRLAEVRLQNGLLQDTADNAMEILHADSSSLLHGGSPRTVAALNDYTAIVQLDTLLQRATRPSGIPGFTPAGDCYFPADLAFWQSQSSQWHFCRQAILYC